MNKKKGKKEEREVENEHKKNGSYKERIMNEFVGVAKLGSLAEFKAWTNSIVTSAESYAQLYDVYLEYVEGVTGHAASGLKRHHTPIEIMSYDYGDLTHEFRERLIENATNKEFATAFWDEFDRVASCTEPDEWYLYQYCL